MGQAPERRSNGSALGAGPCDLDRVRGDGEAVLGGEPREPAVQLTVAELDDPVAFLAHQVVVMTGAAQAVAGLAGMVHEGVDHAVLAEERERPVDRRQPDALASRPEARMDLLRGRVVGLEGQRSQHRDALPGRTQPAMLEEDVEVRLRLLGHRH
jgi:hypothetical protein